MNIPRSQQLYPTPTFQAYLPRWRRARVMTCLRRRYR